MLSGCRNCSMRTDTQKHYDHDDLTNLRAAMKPINFEG